MDETDVEARERLRIATWLRAKSFEVEGLIKTAAERHDRDTAVGTRAMATRMAVLLRVLAGFVENNTLHLREPK